MTWLADNWIALGALAISCAAFYRSWKSDKTAAALRDYDYQARLRTENIVVGYDDGFSLRGELWNKGQKPIDIVGVELALTEIGGNGTCSLLLHPDFTLMPGESVDLEAEPTNAARRWAESHPNYKCSLRYVYRVPGGGKKDVRRKLGKTEDGARSFYAQMMILGN